MKDQTMCVTYKNRDAVYNALLKHLDATDFVVMSITGDIVILSHGRLKFLLHSSSSPSDRIKSRKLADILRVENMSGVDRFVSLKWLKHRGDAKIDLAKTVLRYLKRDSLFIDAPRYGEPFAPLKAKCYEQFMVEYELKYKTYE